MLGISFGELVLIIGATAALIKPKDLPIVAKVAGRLVGRAVGYVQLARGQLDNILQQSQAGQVHKELKDAMSQIETIRFEIQRLSVMNPGPTTRRLMDIAENATAANGDNIVVELAGEKKKTGTTPYEDHSATTISSTTMHSQAMAYARLAEFPTLKTVSLTDSGAGEKLNDDGAPFRVLPVSAESIGWLQNRCDRADDVKGSDIMLEAIVEEMVAHKAKDFFAQADKTVTELNKDPEAFSIGSPEEKSQTAG